MAKSAGEKIKASTQEHLDIDDITEDLVILKNGWVAMALSTTAVNFDILSEAEQDATIYAYGALLNSLTFPVQVLIRSKKADITAYYQHLVEAEAGQSNPDLKEQIRKYREFVQSTVQQKTILDKRFYLVIHFTSLELGVKSFKKTDTTNKKSKAQLIIDAKNSLSPKREHLVKQTARLGLFTKQLSTQELIELFYDIYNPAPTGTQRVILNASSYTTPLVEPDLETPTPEPEAAQVSEGNALAEVVPPVTGAGAVVEPASSTLAPLSQPVPPLTSQPMPAMGIPGEIKLDQIGMPPVILPKVETPPPGDPNLSSAQNVGPGVSGAQQDALSSLQEAIKRASAMSGSVPNANSGQSVGNATVQGGVK